MATELLFLDPRRVGGMGDVDGERKVGLEREHVVAAPFEPISSWTAATVGHLPLESAALVDPAQRLEGHVGAETIVE